MKVLCVLADGFEETEAITVIDLLRRAQIQADVFALESQPITGSHGLTLANLSVMDWPKADAYDVLFISGGRHYKTLQADQQFVEMADSFMKADRYVAAICAGPTILGHSGWLKDRDYTCFTSMNEDFGGRYHDQPVCRDGKLLTGRSMAAALDFGLELINMLVGSDREAEIKARIYY